MAALDPGNPLQAFVYARLIAATAVISIVPEARIVDDIPAPPGSAPSDDFFPYVVIGDDQVVPDRGDRYDGREVTVTIETFSRGPGFFETKALQDAIENAVTFPGGEPVSLGGEHRLILLDLESARRLREPDGITRHGVQTFRALTEPI